VRNRYMFGIAAATAAAVMFAWSPAFSQDRVVNGVAVPAGKGKGKGKQRPPSRPTPHHPDGRVNLGPMSGEKGVWNGSAGATFATNVNRGIDNTGVNLPTNLKTTDVPMLPWARMVYDFRQASLTADDPHVRCKSSGGPRLYHTPYGFEIVDIPEMKQIFVMGVGGPHTYRVIYMDGREHPKDLRPTYHGHSIGKWEGETLVVDTVGYNERFWLTREGIPHTSNLHLVEKFTRPEYDTLRYEATIDDPATYTSQWSGGWAIPWNPTEEMYEYVCQENNRDGRHMFGGER
jgi:hypothetical protein